jgi:hypothetical protein
LTPNRTSRQEKPETPHQRPYDPAEEAGAPLVSKNRAPEADPERDPHAALNNPVGEPDPTADSDPFDPDPADPPPPGKFPGPGPEPEEES